MHSENILDKDISTIKSSKKIYDVLGVLFYLKNNHARTCILYNFYVGNQVFYC